MEGRGDIKIRQAAMTDVEQLCRARNNEQLFKEYLSECDGENAYFLVAELDETIVGFGLVFLNPTANGKKKSHLPKLSDLYVVESCRRRGVGCALILAGEARARMYGHSEIYVSIDPTESCEMIALALKLRYHPLQSASYPVSARFYDREGRAYLKHYFRLDFAKELR